MGTVNNAIIVGNVGRDPELRTTHSGVYVCTLAVATDRRQGGEDVTDWHRITVWGAQAVACARYLQRGSQVAVEGEIRYSSWTDAQGVERYGVAISARRVTFLARTKTAGDPPRQAASTDRDRSPSPDDEIPF